MKKSTKQQIFQIVLATIFEINGLYMVNEYTTTTKLNIFIFILGVIWIIGKLIYILCE